MSDVRCPKLRPSLRRRLLPPPTTPKSIRSEVVIKIETIFQPAGECDARRPRTAHALSCDRLDLTRQRRTTTPERTRVNKPGAQPIISSSCYIIVVLFLV